MVQKPTTFVALLRGINVGGKNKLPMKDLVALFERAGARDVQHYIQSGNVVFAAAEGDRIAESVRRGIERDHGLKVPLVLRTAAEMRSVLRTNPFLDAPDADPKPLHVAFLADKPAKERASLLDPQRSVPDAFVLRGRDLYLRLPNGVARSKLTNAYFDTTLRTTSTVRNWATVERLAEMAGG
jgi:uncharacterized protein (DUF1697 family)